jgi:hypothetical protein
LTAEEQKKATTKKRLNLSLVWAGFQRLYSGTEMFLTAALNAVMPRKLSTTMYHVVKDMSYRFGVAYLRCSHRELGPENHIHATWLEIDRERERERERGRTERGNRRVRERGRVGEGKERERERERGDTEGYVRDSLAIGESRGEERER